MKNDFFDIKFNSETGFLESILLCDDKDNMNWCLDGGKWGCIRDYSHIHKVESAFYKENGDYSEVDSVYFKETHMESFAETSDSVNVVFVNEVMTVENENSFDGDGNFVQKFVLKNTSDVILFLNPHSFSVEVPFNDVYTYADECMIKRCNTHIWCGGNTTYINALKMGVSEHNLGLVLTKGSFETYSVMDTRTNHRGRFLLNFDRKEMLPGEEYVIEWVIFSHTGTEDFYKKAARYESFVDIRAKHHTVFGGEKIVFSATCKKSRKMSEFIPKTEIWNIIYAVMRFKLNIFRKNTENVGYTLKSTASAHGRILM